MTPRQRLIGYFTRYKGRYVAGAVLLLLTNILNVLFPWLVRDAIDGFRDLDARSLLGIVGLMFLVAVAAMVARTFTRVVIFNAGRDIEFDIRNDLFSHLQKLSASYYQSMRTGDIMSRATNDLSSVRLMLGPGVLNIVNTPFAYLLTIGAMMAISWKLTLIAAVPFPFFLLIAKVFSRHFHERSLEQQAELANLSSRIQENLSGIAVIRAYVREAFELERFEKLNMDYYAINIRLARLASLMIPIISLVPKAGVLIVLYFGGRLVIDNEMSIGDFVGFTFYIFQLMWPTFIMGWVLTMLQRGLAATGRINEIFEARPEIRDAEGVFPVDRLNGEIEVRNLCFAYPNGSGDGGPNGRRQVLRNVSLRVPQGTTLAIVGRTGSGKSTLVNLIPRLFTVPDGAIFIDGVDINRIPLFVLRRSIGMVPQDAFLFSSMVSRNIAYGMDVAAQEQIEEAATMARVDGDIGEFAHGYETIVGERGVTLSGGQRQRITLARALIVDPRILVLDDALSSVDAHTEDEILGALRDVRRGRTVIIISHRISAVRDADQIAVLEDGELVESGRHEDLIRTGGIYATIYREQQLEQELEEA